MKKMIFILVLTIAGSTTANNLNSIVSAITELKYKWNSTCGISHTATFYGNWSALEIAHWVSNQNEKECGTKPKNVFVNLAPSIM